jgi:general secretion pathway protein A
MTHTRTISAQQLFGFVTPPFTNRIDYYTDVPRQRLTTRLSRTVQTGGIAALTGDCGTGKTALINHFSHNYIPTHTTTTYIPYAQLNDTGILQTACYNLGLTPSLGNGRTINILTRHLQTTKSQLLLILDDAQHAQGNTLESLRLLTGTRIDNHTPITLILVGTPDLLDHLQLNQNQSLCQRITCFGSLHPFSDSAQTTHYIHHHLTTAHLPKGTITPPALALIHQCSGGLSRLINQLALGALEEAAADSTTTVELTHVERAIEYTLMPAKETMR